MVQDFSLVLYALFVLNLLFLMRVRVSFVSKEFSMLKKTAKKVKMRRFHFALSCLGLLSLFLLVVSAIYVG